MSTLRIFFAAVSLIAVAVGTPSSATTLHPSAAMTTPATIAADSSEAAAEREDAAVNDARQANDILDGLKTKYRGLKGVTVTMGTTPGDKEAVAFYTEGRIVISRAHTVSIDKILAHEIWHVIDWRDNGQLDWHENLPPSNASAYLKK